MSDAFKNLLYRALHTFWQAFSVAFLMPDSAWDFGALQAAAFAAVAAGLSAVKTFFAGLVETVDSYGA